MLRRIALILSLLLLFAGCSTKDRSDNDETTTQETSLTGSESTEKTGSQTEMSQTDPTDGKYIIYIYTKSAALFVLNGEEAALASFISVPEGIQAGEYFPGSIEEWFDSGESGFSRYAVDFGGGIMIGSAMYFAEDRNTLIPSSYATIGEKNGYEGIFCADVKTAKWIYDNYDSIYSLRVIDGEAETLPEFPIPPADEKIFTDPTDEDIDGDTLPYYIYVEKGSATITIYVKAEDGEYTRPILSYRTAYGKTPARTPAGKYTIGAKERWHEFKYPYDGGFAQYASYFHKNLMIHSPIYFDTRSDALTVEFYKDIGGPVTAGCLRTMTEAAYWIYTYCPEGTAVEIVNGDPLGTVSQELPPIDPAYPTTDPTDPLSASKRLLPARGLSDCADTGYVNIRSGPGLDNPVVAKLSHKTYITVHEEKSGWFGITADRTEGYVIASAIIFPDNYIQAGKYIYDAKLPQSTGTEILPDGKEVTVEDDLILITSIIPDIHIQLLFSGEDNFTGKKIYPNELCMLQRKTAEKLAVAQREFSEKGYSIIVYDAYRPHSVQQILFDAVKDPIFVADPAKASHHNRGAAVDISLIGPDGEPVKFLTPIHSFLPESSAKSQREDPEIGELFGYFVSVMENAGFYNYENEWWHFSDKDYMNYMVTDHDLSTAVIYGREY